MAIGIDLDEVVFPLVSKECKFLNKKYGINMSEQDFPSYKFWENSSYRINGVQATKQQTIDDFYEFIQTPEFRKIKPCPGAVKAIIELNKLDSLVAITSRQHELKEHTQWQLGYFFSGAFQDVIFGNHYSKNLSPTKSKRQMCRENNISLLLEDNWDYAYDVSQDFPVILFNKPWNENRDSARIIRVSGWKKAVAEAKKIYRK